MELLLMMNLRLFGGAITVSLAISHGNPAEDCRFDLLLLLPWLLASLTLLLYVCRRTGNLSSSSAQTMAVSSLHPTRSHTHYY
jgi:hypothetical protein